MMASKPEPNPFHAWQMTTSCQKVPQINRANFYLQDQRLLLSTRNQLEEGNKGNMYVSSRTYNTTICFIRFLNLWITNILQLFVSTVRGCERTCDAVSEHLCGCTFAYTLPEKIQTPSHYFTLQNTLPPVCFPNKATGFHVTLCPPSALVSYENTLWPSPPSISSAADQRHWHYN